VLEFCVAAELLSLPDNAHTCQATAGQDHGGEFSLLKFKPAHFDELGKMVKAEVISHRREA
jgi:hypothetical protein